MRTESETAGLWPQAQDIWGNLTPEPSQEQGPAHAPTQAVTSRTVRGNPAAA